MNHLVLVFVGAGVGGTLRHLVTGAVGRFGPTSSLPLGTLVVNLSGCLAAGIVAGLLTAASGVRDEHRALLLVGLLGGYTTFSAFGKETLQLIESRRIIEAVLYVTLTNVVGVAAVWTGHRIAAAIS